VNSRDRILAAMEGREPDRIPKALSFYPLELEGFPEPPLDVRFVEFPPSSEEEDLARRAMPYPADTRLGRPDLVETYSAWRYQPAAPDQRNPLARARSLEDLERFPFPALGGPGALPALERQVSTWRERGLAVGGNPPHLGGELFEAAWRLRGLENFLVDLIRRPEWAHLLLDRLAELADRNARWLARAGIDVLSLDDDVGMPGTMMISPRLWRTFFKPRMAAIIEGARSVRPEVKVLYHSDGYFEPILDDLVEIGVDAINPLQPEHMDASRIRRRYGPRLALWGTVGRQTTFSFGTPDQIREEVRQRVAELGRAGLVLCPAYDIDEPDIPRANVEAFLEAAETYG
jgi:uroporphyrinogen decarboxylase